MKRIYLLLLAIILTLVAANIYYYLNIYKQQVDFQKNILKKQTEICSREIEQHVTGFMSEMNMIIFSDGISDFFGEIESGERKSDIIIDLFSKFGNLITSITLYDDQNNVYNLFKDSGNNPITDYYVSREQREILDKQQVLENNGESVFTFPIFRNMEVTGNMVVITDHKRFIESIFDNYYIENTLYQWLINSNGKTVYSNFSSDFEDVSGFEEIIHDQAWPEEGGSLIHRLKTATRNTRVISTYCPIKVIDRDMIVAFSLDTNIVLSSIINSIITIAAATFIVLILIIGFFVNFLKNVNKEKKNSEESEIALKEIFESLPFGIMIKGSDSKIRSANSTALKILKIEKAEDIIGKDISNLFFLFKDYRDSFSKDRQETTREFVYYDSDEEEKILYKKEIPLSFRGEDVTVEAFIDISPLEKARKREFLWGEAKSEFLKRVSHDIRNPLNVILNLADSMGPEAAEDSPEKGNAEIIRSCCEDILMVVNDIMDFSSFESGKVLVEEIPFSLSEEIDLATGPLLNKAKEKGARIITSIDPGVPEIIIGDPFQVRQLLTNLLSNSIKYSEKGLINLSVKTTSKDSGNVTLEFIIEDNGTGMSPSLVRKFNERDNMQDLLSTGSYGLNKTRQIINLLKGSINIESPVPDSQESGGPGTRVKFYITLYSNEISGKKLDVENIASPEDLKTIILTESDNKKTELQKILKELKIPCETISFNDSTVELIKSRIENTSPAYSVIFIIDSKKSNGFSIARQLHNNNIDKYFLIVFVSSLNKPGNFIKSRRFGADHYLIEPYAASEIASIILNNFSQISFPGSVADKKGIRSDLSILVAEDNPSNQIVAQSLFKRLGYEIDLAVNGKEAVQKVREKEYDIIFMDIKMPEKNGLDATYEIRKLGYNMPIIAMTANAGEADKAEAIGVGMDSFISKPVSIDVLKNIIIKRF